MSLLDVFVVRDAVLETVMQQDVYVAIRNDASASATQPIGAGTWDDPWGGTEDNPAWFDYMMTNKVQPNQTVRLAQEPSQRQGTLGMQPTPDGLRKTA